MAERTKKKRDSQTSMKILLDAAIEVFADRGPNAATVDEIARRAGLNKRMLYHYFGSKDKLYAAALVQVYEGFDSFEIPLASMMLPVEELIRSLVQQYHMFLMKNPNFVRLISHENLDGGRTIGKLKISHHKAPIINALQLALEKGQAEGRFKRSIDVSQLVASIAGLCFFYFSNAHTMRKYISGFSMTRAALDKRIEHVADLILHGISAGAKESE